MEYIISRNFTLPTTSQEFEAGFHFNLWSRKLWPYEKFETGDILYWYETPSGCIVWKTRTVKADGFFIRVKITCAKCSSYDLAILTKTSHTL